MKNDLLMPNYTSFEAVSPEEVGITSASLLNLIDLTKEHNVQLHSLMVLRHGKVAAQLWWKPYAPDIPHHLYSFSKSFTSTAVGFAISEGLLSLDDRIVKFFPRRISESADPRIYSVTVRHLLTMTSGAVSVNEAGMQSQIDWVEWFLNTPLQYFPGEKFIYNSMNTYMLAAILRAVTKTGLVDYLMPRLFEPLGIARPEWSKCPLGIECGGWGLNLKTEDLAKFSQLYLDDGMWHGRRILPEGWAEQAGSKQVSNDSDTKFSDNPDSHAGYGFQFWVNRDGVSYRGDGMMGQYGIIMPEKDLVVVTTAGCTSQMDVLDLMWQAFFPLIDSIPEGSEPGKDYEDLCDVAAELTLGKPVSVVRRREIEDRINGRTFTFSINMFSMIPIAIRYLYDIPPLGIDRVRFDFTDDECGMTWHEDGVDNHIDFTLDGEYSSGTLSYGGRMLATSVCAAWISDDTLELDIRIIKTPHMLKAFFRFDDSGVHYTYGEDPSLEDSMRTLFDLVKILRPVSDKLAKVAERIITPELDGKMEAE